jgi:hypothetical protein
MRSAKILESIISATLQYLEALNDAVRRLPILLCMHWLRRAAQCPSQAIAASSARTVRCLTPCRQKHHPELKEWGNKPVLPVRAAANEPTPSKPLEFVELPADSSLRPKPHNARPIFTRARAAGCCTSDKRAEKGETALGQRPCATHLPPSRVPDKGPRPQPDKAGGRHRRSTFSSERSCHASASGLPALQ